MWLPYQEKTANDMPVDRMQMVRVLLRNGRQMTGFAGNFTWGDVGSATIIQWAMPDLNAPEAAAAAGNGRPIAEALRPTTGRVTGRLRDDMPTFDVPKKKKIQRPTRYEQLSRCLPDGVLWGDEMTFETVDKIIDTFCNREW